jgi:hypothetical protein
MPYLYYLSTVFWGRKDRIVLQSNQFSIPAACKTFKFNILSREKVLTALANDSSGTVANTRLTWEQLFASLPLVLSLGSKGLLPALAAGRREYARAGGQTSTP